MNMRLLDCRKQVITKLVKIIVNLTYEIFKMFESFLRTTPDRLNKVFP